jgi:glycosyltransferase involved in cell wall biosynthesis
MPKVSVIVPNYNHARFLTRRLDSIMGQTFGDFEVIILDDASTDGSHDVIRLYLADPRVSFHPNEANSGSPFIQWNRGVQLGRGDYVWIAEADDYADREFLATLVPILEEHPHVGLAYCQSRRVDDQVRPLGTFAFWTENLDRQRWKTGFVNQGADECKNYLLWKNTIPNASAALLRKSTYLQAGGAPENMRLCGDWLTWVRMTLISDVAFAPQSLNHFCTHFVSVRETTPVGKFLDEKWNVQRTILRQCAVSKSARREVAKQNLNELLIRVLTAPPAMRRREALRGLVSFWPFFVMAPATVIKVFFSKASKKIGAFFCSCVFALFQREMRPPGGKRPR